jgi:8-oxo-dGTP pyrophosphatase MutT (NUDIX family)
MNKRAPHPTAVTPRAAATTLIVRDGTSGLEVLMVRRSLSASFMPGAYVFPGGAVDNADASVVVDEQPDMLALRIGAVTEVGDMALAYAVAALRECFEECGLWLGADDVAHPWAALRARLHAGESIGLLARSAGLPLATRVLQPWSHWVTPVGLPKRFDTLFFVAPAPAGQEPEVDAGETTTLAWVHPAQALAEHQSGGFPMEFATVSTVQSLRPFDSATALLVHAAAQRYLPPLHPRLRLDGEGHVAGVVLPGEPGYREAFQAP